MASGLKRRDGLEMNMSERDNILRRIADAEEQVAYLRDQLQGTSKNRPFRAE